MSCFLRFRFKWIVDKHFRHNSKVDRAHLNETCAEINRRFFPSPLFFTREGSLSRGPTGKLFQQHVRIVLCARPHRRPQKTLETAIRVHYTVVRGKVDILLVGSLAAKRPARLQ